MEPVADHDPAAQQGPAAEETEHHCHHQHDPDLLHRISSIQTAESLASIERPPEDVPPPKVYHPLSLPVIALLAPASIFGVLARLGLQSLGNYDGQSIFTLAYVQAVGCLVMGFCLTLKEPFGRLYAVWAIEYLSACHSLVSPAMVRSTRL